MIAINFIIKERPYQLTHDTFQFVIGENPYTNKKTGETKWTVCHYYATLAGVARYLVQQGLANSDAEILIDLNEQINQVCSDIKAALNTKIN